MLNDKECRPERILVIVELTGGNDGLDTVIPHTNDEYYKARPTLSVRSHHVLKAGDDFGFHPSLGGMHRLYERGLLGIVHGCGYPSPNLSHFSSMEVWHTATPHDLRITGWVGRLADSAWSRPEPNTVINIAVQQCLAVSAEHHCALVFYNPEELVRKGEHLQKDFYSKLINCSDPENATLNFLANVSRSATDSSTRVRQAVGKYSTPIPYEATPLAQDLKKVAALINAGFSTRVYYVSLTGFDTHAGQTSRRHYLLAGLGEAVCSFQEDMKRIGCAGDVSMMMFSEFGRRVKENASGGTDHGAAGPMFLVGPGVNPGFHGIHPSLTDLDENHDLKMTVDFRRVYASVITEWLRVADSTAVLGGDFKPLSLFA